MATAQASTCSGTQPTERTIGVETLVNTYTTGHQSNGSSVSMNDSGDIVVAWASSLQDSPDGWGVYAQRFDAGGPVGGEFLVNTTIAGTQRAPERRRPQRR